MPESHEGYNEGGGKPEGWELNPRAKELVDSGLTQQEVLECMLALTGHFLSRLLSKAESSSLSGEESLQIGFLTQIEHEILASFQHEDPETLNSCIELYICALQEFGISEEIFSPKAIHSIKEEIQRLKDQYAESELTNIEAVREEINAEIAADNEADFWKEVERRTRLN